MPMEIVMVISCPPEAGDGRAPATRESTNTPAYHMKFGPFDCTLAFIWSMVSYEVWGINIGASRLRRLVSAFLTPGRGSSPITAWEFGCRILDDTGDITQVAASDGSVCWWIVNTFLPNAGALTMMVWRERDEQKLYKPRAPNFDRARYAIPGAKVPGWYRFFWVQLAEDRLETARIGRYMLRHSDMSKNQQRIWVVFHHQGGSVDCSYPASVSRQ